MPHTMLSSNALIWLLMLTIVQHSCLGRSIAETGDALNSDLDSSLSTLEDVGYGDRNMSQEDDPSTMGDTHRPIADTEDALPPNLNSSNSAPEQGGSGNKKGPKAGGPRGMGDQKNARNTHRPIAETGDALPPNLNYSHSAHAHGGYGYRNMSHAGDPRGMGNQKNVLNTLQHLGDIAIKIVTQVQGREVDLNSITKMLTEMAKASVMVNNPKMMPPNKREDDTNMIKQDVNQRIQEMKKENKQMKDTVRNLVSEKSRSKKNQSRTSYEFQAFANMKQTLKNTAIIKFANVHIDESDSYNKDLGFYTCPDDGDYFISATITPYHMDSIRTSPGYRMVAAHVKQGSEGSGRILFHMSAIRVSTSKWSTGSGSYISHCKKGDNIWVEGAEYSSSSSLLQGGADEYETMFHIFKMK